MIYNLSEKNNDNKIKEAIMICKSNSGKMGTELRKAHGYLGQKICEAFKKEFSPDAIVICFMRAGLPFSLGFLNELDCSILFFDDKKDKTFFNDNKELLKDKQVIFIDSVINTGNFILESIKKSGVSKENVKVVTNVLCDKAIDKFNDYSLYTVRVSSNSFTGSKVKEQKNGKGPDTGDRLFRTLC